MRHEHVRDYADLRKRLFRRGLGYVGCLLKIALRYKEYRRLAAAEAAGWLIDYHLPRLYRAALKRGPDSTLPVTLVAVEIAGGLFAPVDLLARNTRRRWCMP